VNGKRFIFVLLGMVALIVYLFVTAPAPLPEQAAADRHIAVESIFVLLEAENDAVRTLWTKEIVAAGQRVGLSFSEDWRDRDAEAGPLPALFLRETARNLEKDPLRLSLFLGSDYPINKENGFDGLQQDKFELIRTTGTPQFFQMPDTALYTAMFPDAAVVEACVNCHNDHEDSPRDDWQLDDVMGATTWAYPDAQLAAGEMLTLLAALRNAFRGTYQTYLDKVATFENPPEIGQRWPRDGYYLPSADVFMDELSRQTAQESLQMLLHESSRDRPAVGTASE
jgi:adenylate cyclase